MENSKWKRRVIVTIHLLLLNVGFTQEKITQLSYNDLQRLQEEAFSENKIEKLRSLIEIHVQKARNEGNSIEVARAWYYRIFIEEPEVGMAYADSIISVTKNSEHKNYPTLGYILKGHIQYGEGNANKALENYLKAYDFCIKKENQEHQLQVSLAIAAIRNIYGQHSAAAQLYRETLRLLRQKTNYEFTHYEDYITLLFNLSLTHIRLSQLDSAKYYIDQGIMVSKKSGDKHDFQDFVLIEAQLNYYNRDYQSAKDTLQIYLNLLDGTSKAIKLYYLGKIEQKLGNDSQAVKNFLKIDSIINLTKDPFNEIKDVYQQLIIYSSLENNTKNQIQYLGKLIYYDSVLSLEQQEITNQAVLAYDIPYLKHQKQKAEEQLKMKSVAVKGVGSLAFLTTCSGLFFYLRNRKMKYKLKLLLEETNKVKPITKVEGKHPASVPDEIRIDILKKLYEFEEGGFYLRKEIDMSTLAQEFGTNTSYLSIVVNHYKKMTFPNYLKDLKISAAISRLKVEPELLKYNYQGLAEVFGFKTADSFSKAFYKKTGVYPSNFLTELKTIKEGVHL